MTKGLNIKIHSYRDLIPNDIIFNEFHDDKRVESFGIMEEFRFMGRPTAEVVQYFIQKGWIPITSKYQEEMTLLNFSVNQRISVTSLLYESSNCWRVQYVSFWQEMVEIDPKILNLN